MSSVPSLFETAAKAVLSRWSCTIGRKRAFVLSDQAADQQPPPLAVVCNAISTAVYFEGHSKNPDVFLLHLYHNLPKTSAYMAPAAIVNVPHFSEQLERANQFTIRLAKLHAFKKKVQMRQQQQSHRSAFNITTYEWLLQAAYQTWQNSGDESGFLSVERSVERACHTKGYPVIMKGRVAMAPSEAMVPFGSISFQHPPPLIGHSQNDGIFATLRNGSVLHARSLYHPSFWAEICMESVFENADDEHLEQLQQVLAGVVRNRRKARARHATQLTEHDDQHDQGHTTKQQRLAY